MMQVRTSLPITQKLIFLHCSHFARPQHVTVWTISFICKSIAHFVPANPSSSSNTGTRQGWWMLLLSNSADCWLNCYRDFGTYDKGDMRLFLMYTSTCWTALVSAEQFPGLLSPDAFLINAQTALHTFEGRGWALHDIQNRSPLWLLLQCLQAADEVGEGVCKCKDQWVTWTPCDYAFSLTCSLYDISHGLLVIQMPS